MKLKMTELRRIVRSVIKENYEEATLQPLRDLGRVFMKNWQNDLSPRELNDATKDLMKQIQQLIKKKDHEITAKAYGATPDKTN